MGPRAKEKWEEQQLGTAGGEKLFTANLQWLRSHSPRSKKMIFKELLRGGYMIQLWPTKAFLITQLNCFASIYLKAEFQPSCDGWLGNRTTKWDKHCVHKVDFAQWRQGNSWELGNG